MSIIKKLRVITKPFTGEMKSKLNLKQAEGNKD